MLFTVGEFLVFRELNISDPVSSHQSGDGWFPKDPVRFRVQQYLEELHGTDNFLSEVLGLSSTSVCNVNDWFNLFFSFAKYSWRNIYSAAPKWIQGTICTNIAFYKCHKKGDGSI